MKQYEYTSVEFLADTTPEQATENFNKMGREGWQLIFTIGSSGFPKVRCWFMREKE